MDAIRTGVFDVTDLSVPYNSTLERAGFNRLASASDTMRAVTNGLGVSDGKIKSQPEQIKRMILARG